jgi:hypothetical protein
LLLLTEVAAPLEGGEVEKPQVERFLDLVDEIAGEEQVRDVRLAQLDAFDLMRIGARRQEGLDVRGELRCGHS